MAELGLDKSILYPVINAKIRKEKQFSKDGMSTSFDCSYCMNIDKQALLSYKQQLLPLFVVHNSHMNIHIDGMSNFDKAFKKLVDYTHKCYNVMDALMSSLNGVLPLFISYIARQEQLMEKRS